MHLLYSASARQELRSYVRAYAQREVTSSGADLVQPVVASLEHVLQFEFHGPPQIEYCDGRHALSHRIAIVGPHTYPRAHLRLNGHVESFGIFFQPLGLWQLYRIPIHELANQTYAARDVLGSQIEQLWMEMAECASFEARVAVTERHLMARAARASGCTSMMDVAIHLFQNQGTSRIHSLAQDTGSSVRQFERRFSAEIGITPKRFARIARFQAALDAKLESPQRTWLHIAHQFGYHDQMHMIHDFRDLSGGPPERIVGELGDTRPPALSGSQPG
jgi:AraC-like DNA-binding protein